MDNLSRSSMINFTVNKMTGDMNFVGMFYIIIGALYSLSIIGAIVGIPLIISGLRLRESSDSFKSYLSSNDSMMLEKAFQKQERFFFIQKIFVIVTIVFIVLYIIGMIILAVFFANYFDSNYYPGV